jgi:hypothetical protein
MGKGCLHAVQSLKKMQLVVVYSEHRLRISFLIFIYPLYFELFTKRKSNLSYPQFSFEVLSCKVKI